MRKFITISVLVVALALTPISARENKWVSVMTHSYHNSRGNYKYNEANYGVGIETGGKGGDWRFALGAYRNSFYNTSAYIGAIWLPVAFGSWKFGGMTGLVSGYPKYDKKFGPIGAGVIAYEGEQYGANILVVPPAPENGILTLALQLKMRYD